MPYITKDRRSEIDQGMPPQTMGELTYALTWQIARYRKIHGDRFQTHGEILGALDATSREYYRRVMGRFEDAKLIANGDIHGLG